MKPIFVYMTAASVEEADKIAQTLVEKRLAACVGRLPGLKAIYRWQGEICHDEEIAMFAETTTGRFDELKEEVLKLHSYDCPCIIAFPIEHGHPPFLQWIADETRA